MVRMPFSFGRRDDSSGLPRHQARRRWRESSQSTTAAAPLETYSMKGRPTFMQWVKLTWLDILSMAILGALTLVVFMQGPAAKRTFPVIFQQSSSQQGQSILMSEGSGDIVYPQFAYPYRDQFIPSHAATLLAIGVPILVFLLAQIRVRSFWDINNAIIGLLYSMVCSTFFQVMIKWLIGGLRPNFLDVCKPDISLASLPGGNKTGLDGTGFGGIMYTSDICTFENKEGIYNSLESFPSGHTTGSFAGLVFLYLYLNAKLKVFSNYHPSMWKLALTYAPILGATLIGGSLTVDQSHNWYDVVAGGLIGTMFAFSSYRMVYASVWDYRTNHIPLHRRQAFVLADGVVGMGWTMTRRAGWGAGRRKGAGRRRGDGLAAGEKPPVTEARTRHSVSPGRHGGHAGSTASANPVMTSPPEVFNGHHHSSRRRPEDMV